MNTEFKEILLGNKANAYFRDQLSGGQALAQFIGTHANLEKGTARTYLPESVIPSEVFNFRLGNKIKSHSPRTRLESPDGSKWVMEPVQNNLPEVLPSVLRFLQSSPEAILICEDFMASKADLPDIIPNNVRLFGDGIYRILKAQESNPKAISNIIRDTADFRFIAFGCYASLDSQILTDEDANSIARTLCFLLTLAYDGEGYVIWEAPSVKPEGMK